MKSIMSLVMGALAVAALMPAAAVAEDAWNQGYVLDPNGEIVTSPITGLCWRSSDWTPARAVQRCDLSDMPVTYLPARAPSEFRPVALMPKAKAMHNLLPSPASAPAR